MASSHRHDRHAEHAHPHGPDQRHHHPAQPTDAAARPPDADRRQDPGRAPVHTRPSGPDRPHSPGRPRGQDRARDRTRNHRGEDHATALTHALVAAGRGYAVLPLTRSKLPAIRSPHHPSPATAPCHGECGRPGHGVHDATSDPLAVRRLFAAAPWATAYGIACGLPPHHLIGLDLDTKHGADSLTALQLLAEAHHFALPPTVTVLTPSGGRHLWLTGPPALPVHNSASRLAPGIDIRGTGGYLVGPGSLTSHGRYRLSPGAPRFPAAAPHALMALLTATPPPRTLPPHPALGPHPATGLIRFVRTSPVGQRNARLFWAACRAYETRLGEEYATALTQAAVSAGLTEREARATIASASRHTLAHASTGTAPRT